MEQVKLTQTGSEELGSVLTALADHGWEFVTLQPSRMIYPSGNVAAVKEWLVVHRRNAEPKDVTTATEAASRQNPLTGRGMGLDGLHRNLEAMEAGVPVDALVGAEVDLAAKVKQQLAGKPDRRLGPELLAEVLTAEEAAAEARRRAAEAEREAALLRNSMELLLERVQASLEAWNGGLYDPFRTDIYEVMERLRDTAGDAANLLHAEAALTEGVAA